jgi:hypothetical protein
VYSFVGGGWVTWGFNNYHPPSKHFKCFLIRLDPIGGVALRALSPFLDHFCRRIPESLGPKSGPVGSIFWTGGLHFLDTSYPEFGPPKGRGFYLSP